MAGLLLACVLCLVTLAAATSPVSDEIILLTNTKYNHSCFWGGPKGMDYGLLPYAQPVQQPVLYPDQGSTYFVGQFYLPKGAYLKVQGVFPHNRYFSFTAAHYLANGGLGGGDNIHDINIIPDEGSVNPFVPGNNRNVKARNFTVYVMQGLPPTPDKKAPNTVYTTSNDPSLRIHLSMRNYIPDVGYDGLGQPLDVDGLPRVTLIQPGQEPMTGDAMCDAVKATKEAEPVEYPVQLWLNLIAGSWDVINAPARRVPVWEIFRNIDYSANGYFMDDPVRRVREHPATDEGGFANNPDTFYVWTPISTNFGDVVVIRGKMPSHPVTHHSEESWGESQLRYWSICTGGAPPSGAAWDCEFDEAVPVDKDGFFTVVVSKPEDRPSNARDECGFKWLDFGPGEGVGTGRGKYPGARGWVSYVYMRFQVTHPDWPESPAHVPLVSNTNPYPQEQFVMKEYYPWVRYESRDQFESHGCNGIPAFQGVVSTS